MLHGGARSWAARGVLLAICLRAFVPAGFMLATVHGQFGVVLCDAGASAAANFTSGHEHPGHHHSQSDPACPYAQSAGPAPLPTLPVLPHASVASVPVLATDVAQTNLFFGPTREQTSRGPPTLA